MDAERAIHRRLDGADNFGQLPWHGSAVGIAQHDRFGSATRCRLQGRQGIARVSLIPIEEMLGVVNDLPPLRLEIRQALLNNPQIVVKRGPQHFGYMQSPCFTNHGANRRL